MSKYAAAHANPQGVGDARPTALAVVEDEGLVGKLAGKVFLVTGATSGFGLETARALHATGADVYITARNAVKASQAIEDIRSTSSGRGKLEALTLELDSLASVRACAREFLRLSNQLNVLICNAAVMACPEGQTQDGFETHFGTNHLGHFALFELLRPALLQSSSPAFNSRVVMISSTAHHLGAVDLDDLDLKKRGYERWLAYGESKTAVIYLALEIERRYGAQGLHATAVMPGCATTLIQRYLDEATINFLNTPEMQKVFKSVEQGAATTVWAAISREWEGRGGRYLEDCGQAKPAEGDNHLYGYAPHAYDQDKARRLWDVSAKLVALPVAPVLRES